MGMQYITRTAEQEERAAAEYSKIAKEKVAISFDGDLFTSPIKFIFGSELGCLRILNRMGSGRVLYSPNLEVWYWRPTR